MLGILALLKRTPSGSLEECLSRLFRRSRTLCLVFSIFVCAKSGANRATCALYYNNYFSAYSHLLKLTPSVREASAAHPIWSSSTVVMAMGAANAYDMILYKRASSSIIKGLLIKNNVSYEEDK